MSGIGQLRTLSDFRDRVTAMFSGYIRCPGVLPTTLTEMGRVGQLLGSTGLLQPDCAYCFSVLAPNFGMMRT